LQFGGSDDSGSDFDENDTTLPFPKPITRSAFLVPDFSPTNFLSSLSNRHQTLEDLRQELRTLSQDLNKELLDLVNENYQDFLSLGSALKGGEEKIEEVKVGLLGFERDVGLVREKVDTRRTEFGTLLREKKKVREDVRMGRALLEVAERIDELEGRLMIQDEPKNEDEENGFADELDAESEEESDEVDGETSELVELAQVSIRRLRRCVEQYLYIREMVHRIGATHPFLIMQEERILRIRNTLLLDLSTALKQARQASSISNGPLLKVLQLYDDMNEEADAVIVLRETQA
jgi:hypothetical protein